MPKNKLPLIALALTLGFGAVAIAQDFVADPAIATMSPEQMVAARQDAMKENGMTLRNAGGLTGEAAVTAATLLVQNLTDLPLLFPEGTMIGDTKALPIIWEQQDAFEAIFGKAREAAGVVLAAAQAGDSAAYGTALRSLGRTCNECHDTYQKPRD